MASAKDLLNKTGGSGSAFKPVAPVKPLISAPAEPGEEKVVSKNFDPSDRGPKATGKGPTGGASSVPTSVRPKV